MKPGKDVEPKTASAANPQASKQRAAVAFVLLTCWLAQLACSSGSYVSPAQLTATAGSASEAGQAIASVNNSQPATATSAPVLAPATEIPTEDPPATGSGDPLPIIPTPETLPTEAPTLTQSNPTGEAPTPTPPNPTGEAVISTTEQPPILYYTQAGDTLKALAARYNVQPAEITSPDTIPPEGLFNPGVLLLIPHRLGETSPSTQLIPDSEVVYSPSALDFDTQAFVTSAGGYLKTYREWRSSGWYDGAGVIERVGIENSINPRLLLAILERQSHWVYGQPQNLAQTDYPIGWLHFENEKKGLYFQLSWAVQQLNIGYYGWREGTVTELTFPDGQKMRLAPDLNAGTVALLYMFSRLYKEQEWAGLLYAPDGLMAQYAEMFGSPWLRSQSVEPLFPATLTQPPLELPFLPGHTWSFTGGPHSAWGQGAEHPRAAVDFAPSAVEHGCYKAEEWVTASAAGLVVRSENGVVVVDLDGDGYEQTGWAIMYLHIATDGRVPLGTWVSLNDHIGHPSCEGGVANGTHVHFARKYNGEWILADGPMPLVLSGWRTHASKDLYIGTLTKGDQVVYSSTVGSYESRITRPTGTPEQNP